MTCHSLYRSTGGTDPLAGTQPSSPILIDELQDVGPFELLAAVHSGMFQLHSGMAYASSTKPSLVSPV